MSRVIRSTRPEDRQLSDAFASGMPLPVNLEAHLHMALSDILQNPGSLVRPGVVLEMAACYGLSETAANDLAIALEYFHTASLLFDDLPCMDDATLRRSAPCTHVVYGEATAVLASLALINRAYFLTWRAVSQSAPGLQQDALACVEHHLGVNGLLHGQSMDLHFAELPHDGETVETIAVRKTVSMVRLTLVLPALLAGAPQEEITLLQGIARCWGLSYQILDDLKDVLHSEKEAGKTVAQDAFLDRPNLAVSIGVDAAVQRLLKLTEEGDSLLEQLFAVRPETAFLDRLCNDLKEEASHAAQDAYQLRAGRG